MNFAALPAEAINQSAGGQRTQFEGAPMMLPVSPRVAVGRASPTAAANGIPAWAIAAGAAGRRRVAGVRLDVICLAKDTKRRGPK